MPQWLLLRVVEKNAVDLDFLMRIILDKTLIIRASGYLNIKTPKIKFLKLFKIA